jgi:hypothetical protein
MAEKNNGGAFEENNGMRAQMSETERYGIDNIDTFSESEKMDRTYLKELYGEDMDFLNKEVRMTRSEYISKYNEIGKNYSERKRELLKSLAVVVAVYAVAIVLAVVFRIISNEFFDLMLISDAGNPRKAAAYITGIFMAFSRILFLSTTAILIICLVTALKNLKRLNRNKKFSIEQLENRKAEFMSAGQYDAGK